MKTNPRNDGGEASEAGSGSEHVSLPSLALLFLRLGATSFGGPAAHIALMEDEFVRRRKWISREEFLDLVGAANLIPGPNSTEVAMHVGLKRGGWIGFILAGICFILPAFLIVAGCGWIYTRYGALPQASGLLAGVKPIIIAVVAQALWGFGKTALKTRLLQAVAFATFCANLAGFHELAALFVAGAVTALIAIKPPKSTVRATGAVSLAAGMTGAASASIGGGVSASAVTFGLTPLFLFFLKVGAVLYGSGYVLLAFLRADLVERFGWLTEAQLLDAVAVGQMTPGPVFTTATFIGYVLGGPAGSVVATIGIFLPAFFFVAISAPLIPRIRRSATAGAFLDGVNAGSLALMAVVALYLARPVAGAWIPALMAVVSGVLLIRYRVNSSWLVVAGALLGAIFL